MEYNRDCGCVVTVSEDTLSVEIAYCPTHQDKKLSLPAEHLVTFTEATDKMITTLAQNMDEIAAAGRKIVDYMRQK